MFLFQRQMMYFPTPASAAQGQNVISIEAAGNDIKVVAHNTDEEHAIIYFGGNAESAHHSHDTIGNAFTGFASYYLNYPGYGGSTGSPSEESILAAADELFQWVSERHQSVSLVGRSLGTGPAVDLASRHNIEKLVLISPYDSITEVAFTHYPIFPMSLLVKDQFDSVGKADKVTANTLAMVALWDRVIPPSHSQNLVDAMTNAKVDVLPFRDADHNTIHQQQEFIYRINEFLKKR